MAQIARRGCNYTEIKNGSTWKLDELVNKSHCSLSSVNPVFACVLIFTPPHVQLTLTERQAAAIDCCGVNRDIKLS